MLLNLGNSFLKCHYFSQIEKRYKKPIVTLWEECESKVHPERLEGEEDVEIGTGFFSWMICQGFYCLWRSLFQARLTIGRSLVEKSVSTGKGFDIFDERMDGFHVSLPSSHSSRDEVWVILPKEAMIFGKKAFLSLKNLCPNQGEKSLFRFVSHKSQKMLAFLLNLLYIFLCLVFNFLRKGFVWQMKLLRREEP